jgi:hypothetical protein
VGTGATFFFREVAFEPLKSPDSLPLHCDERIVCNGGDCLPFNNAIASLNQNSFDNSTQ